MTLKNKVKILFSISTLLSVIAPINTWAAETLPAELTWSKRVELSSPVNGVIQDVFSRSGKVVAKGDVLVQLDPRIFKANVKYAKAAEDNMQERYQETKRELDRQADMYDRGMLSDHDMQTAKNNLNAALSQLKQAQAKLVQAKINLEYSAVRAPFNATVVSNLARKGQVVSVKLTPPVLAIVAEANRMLARFYADDAQLAELTIDQGAQVIVAGKNYQGKITNIALEPSQLKKYAVDIIFDTKGNLLRAGQKASITL